MTAKTQKELLEETHDTVVQLKTALVGINGQDGLFEEVREMCKSIKENRKICIQNRLSIIALVAFLTGLGVLQATNLIDMGKLFGG